MSFTEECNFEGCLKDIGLNKKQIAEFADKNTIEIIKLLEHHRKNILDIIHAEEKRLSCVDYLIFQYNKKRGEFT